MATALHSFIVEKERVLVQHTFFGKDDDEAQKWKKHHLESCGYYRAAEKEGRVIEILEEIDELPLPDEEYLNAFLGFDDEEEDEDETELAPEERE